MKHLLNYSLFSISLFFLSAVPALAQAEESLESDPLGYYPELISVIILIIATLLIWLFAKKTGEVFRGGLMRIGFASFSIMLAIFTLMIDEILSLEENTYLEIVFEGMIILSGIILVLGVKKISDNISRLGVHK